MKQKETKKLMVEPTVREIEDLKNKLYQLATGILQECRNSCHLSIRKAAELLEVDCKNLCQHENNRDMYLTIYFRTFTTYLLYIRLNKIEKSPELQQLIAEFCELLTK